MRNLLLSACLLAGPAALAATMASQPWVTNRIAEAVAAIPAPDLTAYLRKDLQDTESQIFGGCLSGFGFNADTGFNDNGWLQYTAHNGNQLAQSLPDYIASNPWGYLTTLANATNYTDAAFGAFAATGSVARAAAYGTPTRWTDATGCVWEVGTELSAWSFSDGLDRAVVYGGFYEWLGWPVYGEDVRGTDSSDYAWFMSQAEATNATRFVYVKSDGSEVTATRTEYEATNLVGRVALTNDIPDVSGYATAEYVDSAASAAVEPVSNLVETVRAESALVYRLYQGSNVVAEVTNYNSSVHAPELRIMQLNESNEYFTVWAETNGLARTLASARQYTDDATNALPATFAPRAWGRTTSGLGFDAPDGMTWVSTSNLVIAGGLEYEKHVTSGGAIWLLESNGMTADFHASGNNTAYLDISAADGTSIFRIEKTDAFLVGVNVDNVSVEGSTLVCGVNVVASEHPLVRVRASLSSGEWIREEDGIPASLATVTWSGSAGNWTCRIQNNTGGNSLFAQMEYLQEGGTKIVNTAPIDVTPGILCTDGIHKVRPVYSNGNITWEVVP